MAKKNDGKKKKTEIKKNTRGREMSLEGRMIKKIVIFFFTEQNEERMCENPGSCLAH